MEFTNGKEMELKVELAKELKFGDVVVFSELLEHLKKELKNNNINAKYRATLHFAVEAIKDLVFPLYPNDFSEMRKTRQTIITFDRFVWLLACIDIAINDKHYFGCSEKNKENLVIYLNAIKKFW